MVIEGELQSENITKNGGLQTEIWPLEGFSSLAASSKGERRSGANEERGGLPHLVLKIWSLTVLCTKGPHSHLCLCSAQL